MRALIMGGTEFISLHLVRSLLRAGHEVTVFNRGKRGQRLPAGVRAIVGDRKDHAGLRERLRGARFDGVFDVTYAPTLGEDVVALLEALEGHPHVIFVSTGRVYDHTLPIPYPEETPRGFDWGDYARHKIAGEPVLLPGHGGWLRQFGHVEDLADAMAAMLGDARAYGRAYNVTGEELITQAGLVELIAELVGRPVTLRHFDPALLKSFDRPAPVFGQNLVYERHAVHTTHKLRLDLGIRPRYTLASGLAHTWAWYQSAGLRERTIDFSFEDELLAKIGA